MVRTASALNSSIMMKIIFCGMFTAVGLLNGNPACLTWDIQGYTLMLQCRIGSFEDPVSFVDPSEITQARCSFNRETTTCNSLHKNGKITTDYAQSKVIFSINNIIPSYVNGKWTCVQGSTEPTTTVSTTEGIIASTDVHLVGKLIDTNKIKLICSSCREPDGQYAEFYTNELSVSSVSYSHDTGKCQQGTRECSPEKCSCSISGNEFIVVLPFNEEKEEYSYGCEMRFTDSVQQYKFLKVATLYGIERNLFNNGTVTKITKNGEKDFIPPKYSEMLTKLSTTERGPKTTKTVKTTEVEKTNAIDQEIWILVGVSSVIVVVFFFIVIVYRFRKKVVKYRETERRGVSERKGEHLAILNKTEKTHDSTVQGCVSTPEETTALIDSTVQGYVSTSEETALIADTDSTEHHIAGRKTCNPCSTRKRNIKALYWCMECGQPLCTECQNVHHALNFSHDHTVILIDEVPKNYNMSTTVYCKEHLNSKCDYLCHNHDTLCCKECMYIIHVNCNRTTAIASLDTTVIVITLYDECLNELNTVENDLKTVREAYIKVIRVIGEDEIRIKKSLSRLSAEKFQDEGATHKQRKNTDLLKKQLESAKTFCISRNSKIVTTLEEYSDIVSEKATELKFVQDKGSKNLLFLYIYSNAKPMVLDIRNHIQKIIADQSPSHLQYQSPGGLFGSIEIMNERVLDISLTPCNRNQFQVPVNEKSSQFNKEH